MIIFWFLDYFLIFDSFFILWLSFDFLIFWFLLYYFLIIWFFDFFLIVFWFFDYLLIIVWYFEYSLFAWFTWCQNLNMFNQKHEQTYQKCILNLNLENVGDKWWQGREGRLKFPILRWRCFWMATKKTWKPKILTTFSTKVIPYLI